MAGIFPNGGVSANLTQNAVEPNNLVAGCEAQYYSTTRCEARFSPLAMNALLSEFVNLINAAGTTYDCNNQNNLSNAIDSLLTALLPTPTASNQVLISVPDPNAAGGFSFSLFDLSSLSNDINITTVEETVDIIDSQNALLQSIAAQGLQSTFDTETYTFPAYTQPNQIGWFIADAGDTSPLINIRLTENIAGLRGLDADPNGSGLVTGFAGFAEEGDQITISTPGAPPGPYLEFLIYPVVQQTYSRVTNNTTVGGAPNGACATAAQANTTIVGQNTDSGTINVNPTVDIIVQWDGVYYNAPAAQTSTFIIDIADPDAGGAITSSIGGAASLYNGPLPTFDAGGTTIVNGQPTTATVCHLDTVALTRDNAAGTATANGSRTARYAVL